MPTKTTPLITLSNVTKKFSTSTHSFTALDIPHLSIEANSFIAIVGQSGSGKSTLLTVLGLLDTPTTGAYLLNGRDVASLTSDEQAHIRNSKIGFVFQRFNLLSTLSAWENVALPLAYAGCSHEERYQRAHAALASVELEHRANHYPHQLSGGQQQRVAIARALINNPEIILADEPTGSLDSQTGEAILALLESIHRTQKTTLILVTHEERLALRASRRLVISDGRCIADH